MQQQYNNQVEEEVGCAGEHEAEVPVEARQWQDRWRSHRWTRAEALNKRRSVTRDDATTNQQKWHDEWRMGDER